MAQPPIDLIYVGDSRVLSINNPGSNDALGIPQLGAYGGPFTNLPSLTVVPAAGGTDGVGAQFDLDYVRDAAGNKANGGVIVRLIESGRGYKDPAKMPTFLIGPPDAGGTNAQWNCQIGGGWTQQVTAGLIAAGYAVARTVLGGYGGAGFENFYPGATPAFEGLTPALKNPATTVLPTDMAVNDYGLSVAAFQDKVEQFCLFWLAKGVAGIILDEPYGSAPAEANNAQINGAMQAFRDVRRTVAAEAQMQGKVFVGASQLDLMLAHPEYYQQDGLHLLQPGIDALVPNKVASYGAALTALFGGPDPYQSDMATQGNTLVDYKPNMPTPFVVTGMGTLNLPTAHLTVGVPSDLPGGRYVWLRRLAGSSGPYTAIGTTTGPDANTPPANAFTDTSCVNGVRYDYGVYALPVGDF